jgi:N-acetylglucosaminyl-diphospho-decaprenol L-rhamnosyltransferase
VSADVAVLIVSYNTEHELLECLQSLRDERRDVRQQVIVVDNASSDGSVAAVRERFPEVELIASPENLGFARGVNLAATRADADHVLLLNPDMVVRAHAVGVLVAFARANPAYGLYGGRTVRRDGTLEPSSCWGLPTLWSMLSWALGLRTRFKGSPIFDPESLGRWERDSVREVGMITGCLLLVRREAWERLGGMDERYWMYGEDTDFSLRARAAGYRPIVCPDAVVVHDVGKASATRTDRLLLVYRGKATVVRRHWTGWRRRAGLALLAAGVGVRALGRLAGAARGQARGEGWATLWRERSSWLQGFPEAPTLADRPAAGHPAPGG